MPSSETFASPAIVFDRIRRAKQDRPREFLFFEPRRGSDNARIVAFRQNDFAIALPCDIKQSIKQIHASHRVRKTRKLRVTRIRSRHQ